MKRTVSIAILATALSISLSAQPAIPLPDASPKASVSQRIGVTDVTIDYNRPAVNKRKIFGGLVPYGVLWRAGANESTTISFTTPVTIESTAVPAGRYALYMLPGESQWTLVLSRFTGSWGTYNYDPAEDAARIAVTPQAAADMQERLTFTFDDFTSDSATASLRWDKLRVPFKVTVDVVATVRSAIEATLRGGKHWNGDAWAQAARWELRNGSVDTALRYADRALELGHTFGALRTKAAVLEKKGDTRGAAQLRERANAIANEAQLVSATAGTLMQAKKFDEAIAYLTKHLADHPATDQDWRFLTMLGDLYVEKGDLARAKESFDRAMAAADGMAKKVEVQDSINAMLAAGK